MPLPIPDLLSSPHRPIAYVPQPQVAAVPCEAHVMKRGRQAHPWQLRYPCYFLCSPGFPLDTYLAAWPSSIADMTQVPASYTGSAASCPSKASPFLSAQFPVLSAVLLPFKLWVLVAPGT